MAVDLGSTMIDSCLIDAEDKDDRPRDYSQAHRLVAFRLGEIII
jgi:hypothetical protein